MTFWPHQIVSLLVPLKHACHLNPESLSEKTEPDFEIEYVDIGNVTLEKGIDAREIFRFADAPSRARKPIRNGDTIISTVRTYLKAIAFVDGASANWIASTGFSVCRPKVSVDAKFLYHAIQSTPFIEGVVAASTGVSYPAITPSTLGDLEVPLPSIETQKTIADFLDRETARIDQLIEKKRRLIELLEEKRASILDWHIFGEAQNVPKYHSHKHERFPKIPEYWGVTSLRRACELLRDGTHLPPPRADVGIPLLSVRNIVENKFINRSDDSLISEADYRELCRSFVVKPGDILMAIVGATIGKAAIVEEIPPFHIQRSLVVMRPKKNIMLSSYLCHFLRGQFFQSLLWESTSFSAQPGIYLSDLGRFPVALPPIQEQAAICARLAQSFAPLEKIRSLVSGSVARLYEYRSSLITAAVTGQMNVATWRKGGTTDRRLDEIEAEMAAAVPPEPKQATV